jgi:hypothetical protein
VIEFETTTDEATGEPVILVPLSGLELLETAMFNKGSAFPEDERSEFGLHGLPVAGGQKTSLRVEGRENPHEDKPFRSCERESDKGGVPTRSDPWPKTPCVDPRQNRRSSQEFEEILRVAEI